MQLTLYDRHQHRKTDLSPNDSSQQEKEVQSDNILTLSFMLPECIEVAVNDYVDFMGERYWAVEKYRPKEVNSQKWEYDIKLYGIESLIKRYLVLNQVDGVSDPVFTLTAPPAEHVRMIVGVINTEMGTTDWKVGTVEGTENVTIDYEGKYCHEGLEELAKIVGTEYWIEGTTVNLCRCEHGEEITLAYGAGLTSISVDKADNAAFYTRLFPVGSSRNIDPSRYGYPRLQLPNGQQYVDTNVDQYGIIHHFEKDAFAEIFPKRIGTVSSVRHETKTGDDGNPFDIYYFTDAGLTFDPNDYMLPGKVIRVSFCEGSEIAGLGTEEDGTYYFEVNYHSDTHEFEIITIFPYSDGSQLPGGVLVPAVGDEYILWNLRMPDEYYPLAEQEFQDAVNEYNQQHALDVLRFKGQTDYIWIAENEVDLTVGQRIRLENSQYFPGTGYKSTRITRIVRKVNIPNLMDIELCDALSTGTKEKLNNEISEIKNYAKAVKQSVSIPDIIKAGDNTRPTDNNLFSAKRSIMEFLSKLNDDTAQGVITFIRGIITDIANSSDFNSIEERGWAISKDQNGKYTLEIDFVKIRQLLEADSADISSAAIDRITSEITFEKLANFLYGITTNFVRSSDYQPGTAGFSIHKTDSGRYMMQIEDLVVLGKMIINELVVDRITYSSGNRRLTGAGMVADKVVPVYRDSSGNYVTDSTLDGGDGIVAYRCYEAAEQNGQATVNAWHVGDQAKCQTFNLDKVLEENFTRFKVDGKFLRIFHAILGYGSKVWHNVSNKFYWRLVVNTGTEKLDDGKKYHYIDLSDEAYVPLEDEHGITITCEGKMTTALDDWARLAFSEEELAARAEQLLDLPAAGDHIVQEGSQTDSQRQHMVSLTVVGPYGPGIEEFSGIGARVDKDGRQCSPFTLNGHRLTAICPFTGDIFYAKEFYFSTYDGTFYRVPVDRPAYSDRETFRYYDRVPYTAADGTTSLWLHVGLNPTVGVAPGTDDTVWTKSVGGVKGDPGQDGQDGWDGQDGRDGTDGDDAYTVVATPSVLIFNQPLAGGEVTTNDKVCKVSVWHGNVQLADNEFSLSSPSGTNCVPGYDNAKKELWVSSLLSGKPSTGSVTSNIMVGGAKVGVVTIEFGVNYNGDAALAIENNLISAFVHKFYYIDNNGVLTECASLADLQISSEQIMQRVSAVEGDKVETAEFDILKDRISMNVSSSEHTDNYIFNGNFDQGPKGWVYPVSIKWLRAENSYLRHSSRMLAFSVFGSCHLISIAGMPAMFINGGSLKQYVSDFISNPSIDVPVKFSFNYSCQSPQEITVEYLQVTIANNTETITVLKSHSVTLEQSSNGFMELTWDAWDSSVSEIRITGGQLAVWNIRLTQLFEARVAKIELNVNGINIGLGDVGIHINGTTKYIDLTANVVRITTGGQPTAIFSNGKIKADLIDAVTIVSTALTSQTITAVDATIKNITIEGSSVFRGTIYASDGEFSGAIHAVNGKFRGNLIAENSRVGIIDEVSSRARWVGLVMGQDVGNSLLDHASFGVQFTDTMFMYGYGILKIKNTNIANPNIVLSGEDGSVKGTISDFQGHNIGCKDLNGSYTLTSGETFCRNIASSSITITLPYTNASIGQMYVLVPHSGMSLRAQGSHQIVSPDGTGSTKSISGTNMHFLVYVGSNKWYLSWTN